MYVINVFRIRFCYKTKENTKRYKRYYSFIIKILVLSNVILFRFLNKIFRTKLLSTVRNKFCVEFLFHVTISTTF